MSSSECCGPGHTQDASDASRATDPATGEEACLLDAAGVPLLAVTAGPMTA